MTLPADAGDLRTSYVGGLGSVDDPADEDLVLGVIRYKYDFVERTVDRNVPALAPPTDLLDAFKRVEESAGEDVLDPARVAWETVAFRERYLTYLDRAGPQDVIGTVRDHLREGTTVWLVCLEAEATFCHRRLLAARIRGDDPAHYSAQYEAPEPNDGSEAAAQAFLDSFGGGSA